MDPALPPGGLNRIFWQYDKIRSHGIRDDGPAPWEPEIEEPSSQPSPPKEASQPAQPPQPPSPPPTEVTGVLTPVKPKLREPEVTPNPNILGYVTHGDVVSLSGPRPVYDRTPDDGVVTLDGTPAASQQVLTDGSQPRPLGRPKSWQSNSLDQMRGELGRRKFLYDLSNPTRSSFARDEVGMQKAYNDTTSQGVYYDPANRTMYVKGTVPSSAKDWWDDVSKIPFWGDIHNADRTRQAEVAYQQLIQEGKPVDRVVGHSLGGSVALQLQKDHDIPISRTFGAPVFDVNNSLRGTDMAYHNARYRHPTDPVSVLDRGATMLPVRDLNAHMYGGYSEEFDDAAPYMEYLNPKKQTNIIV